MPLLHEVFDLFDRELLVNIEVKTPKTVELRPNYDTDRLIRELHRQLHGRFNEGKHHGVEEMEARHFSFISSFDYDFIERYKAYEIEQGLSEHQRAHFVYLNLRNPDSVLPGQEETDLWDKGTNIQVWGCTPEVVERFHKNN